MWWNPWLPISLLVWHFQIFFLRSWCSWIGYFVKFDAFIDCLGCFKWLIKFIIDGFHLEFFTGLLGLHHYATDLILDLQSGWIVFLVLRMRWFQWQSLVVICLFWTIWNFLAAIEFSNNRSYYIVIFVSVDNALGKFLHVWSPPTHISQLSVMLNTCAVMALINLR